MIHASRYGNTQITLTQKHLKSVVLLRTNTKINTNKEFNVEVYGQESKRLLTLFIGIQSVQQRNVPIQEHIKTNDTMTQVVTKRIEISHVTKHNRESYSIE